MERGETSRREKSIKAKEGGRGERDSESSWIAGRERESVGREGDVTHGCHSSLTA